MKNEGQYARSVEKSIRNPKPKEDSIYLLKAQSCCNSCEVI